MEGRRKEAGMKGSTTGMTKGEDREGGREKNLQGSRPWKSALEPSAPAPMRMAMHSAQPFSFLSLMDAQCNGVPPEMRLAALMSAPATMRIFAHSTLPQRHAMCSAVCPTRFCVDADMPAGKEVRKKQNILRKNEEREKGESRGRIKWKRG